MPVTPARLAACYPRLYNVSDPRSWPSIERHGLLSTTALLRLFEAQEECRLAAESRRRASSMTFTHEEHGTAVIRDQIPMNDAKLEECLEDGMTPRDWYENLNRRVFFWPTEERLTGMLLAAEYRGREHVVITVDTEALLESHAGRVGLSPINSGNTRRRPEPRGRETFLALEEYPFEERWRKYFRRGAVAELTVDRAVPDVLDLAVSVELRRGAEVVRTLRPSTS